MLWITIQNKSGTVEISDYGIKFLIYTAGSKGSVPCCSVWEIDGSMGGATDHCSRIWCE